MGSVALIARRRAATLPSALASPWTAAAAIALLAAALRVPGLGGMRENFFYDAAVRSMSLSWHNFFVGAFDPSASLAVDKPPIDLWLQVASVKVLGFNRLALSLPQALAGSGAVLLAFDVGRRLFGNLAGLGAALALAVLPVSVVTSRSDTMDSLMMALALLAVWLTVRAVETGRARWLYLAAFVAGVDFNVKLFAALVPVPAVVLFFLIAAPIALRHRIRQLAVAMLVLVATSLSWAAAVSTLPLHNRPYPIGSTNGSVWNVIFIYNGLDRIRPPAGRHISAASPPGVTRLFTHGFGDRLGSELLPAILAGALALAIAVLLSRSRLREWVRDESNRTRLGGIVMVAAWLIVGVVMFSRMAELRQRYLEAVTPPVALALGAGLAAIVAATRRSPAFAVPALAILVLSGVLYALRMPVSSAVVAVAIAAAGAAVLLAALRRPGVAAAAALVALLVAPAAYSAKLAANNSSDAGIGGGGLTAKKAAKLDRFATAHRAGGKYLIAAAAPAKAAALIARHPAPMLFFTSYGGRPLISARTLAANVRKGQVHVVVMDHRCRPGTPAGCAPAVQWVLRHGVDVSRQAGFRKRGLLYLVGPKLSSRARAAGSRRTTRLVPQRTPRSGAHGRAGSHRARHGHRRTA